MLVCRLYWCVYWCVGYIGVYIGVHTAVYIGVYTGVESTGPTGFPQVVTCSDSFNFYMDMLALQLNIEFSLVQGMCQILRV